jgi:hypothetical protein
VITAIASAVAAYVCSKVWSPGTLASAAFTPVLVALVKEALRRPTEVVTTAVPPVLPGRQRRGQAAAPAPTATGGRDEPQPGADLPQPAIVAVSPPPITYHRTTSRRAHWRIALITGLLGFALCAAVYTVPELLAKGQGTTLFGGGGKHVTRTISTESTTVIKPGKTVTTTAPTTTATTPATTPTQPSTEATPTAPTVAPTATTTAPTTPTTPATTGTETTPTTTEALPSNPVP